MLIRGLVNSILPCRGLSFRGLQVRLASYCSSAVAHRKLLAKKELYKAKLSLLDHVST